MNLINRIERSGSVLALTAAILLQTGCATEAARPTADIPASTCAAGDITAKTSAPRASLPVGCINRANLRAMVADPADLDHGRMLAPASGAQEARGIEAYNKGQVKAFSANDQTGSTTTATATPSTGGK